MLYIYYLGVYTPHILYITLKLVNENACQDYE